MWWENQRHLEITNDSLFIGGISAQVLAERYGTPLYVVDLDRVKSNYQRLRDALDGRMPDVGSQIFYAVKANFSPAILGTLREVGAGADVASSGEMKMALNVGFDPARMLFTGTSLGQEEIEQALESHVLLNVDSMTQLRRIAALSPRSQVMLRYNPGVGSGRSDSLVMAVDPSLQAPKFGLPRNELLEAARFAKKLGLDVVGIHQHVGSGWLKRSQRDRFFSALRSTLSVMNEVRSQSGYSLNVLDIGGGLGIRRRDSEPEFPVEKYIDRIGSYLEKYFQGSIDRLIVEPGGFLVEDAGILLTTVTTIDQKAGHKIVGVNVGLNALNGAAYYGEYYEIVPVEKPSKRKTQSYTVVGNICEPRDVFADHRSLPKLEAGDVIAMLNCGAYSSVFASFYNGRPIPGEVYLSDQKIVAVSPQRSVQDYVTGPVKPGGSADG